MTDAGKPKVAVTLDGRRIEVPEGTLVIEAARSAGIEVPHYCYHPALGNPAVCRLCMVEVEGTAKLQASCRLRVREGMTVRTSSGPARLAQAASLEFHLVNHPLDCPVCDQAGECWLQDYYMRYGLYPSSVRESKEHKAKRVDIGAHVMLDEERCILCTRCVRFLDQVPRTGELGIFHRGDKSVLEPYPGLRVDNPYSGNVVDICPVGALTDKDFRFQARVWYLDAAPSVCSGCSRGCSIEVHSNTKRPWHAGGRRVVRLKPRVNPEVNGWWICDEGRYSYKAVDSPGRLKRASLLDAGSPRAAPWPEASRRIALELKAQCEARGPEGLAVVLSGTLSNEDLFLARALFASALGVEKILVSPGPDQLGEEDAVLRRREKVPNLRGARALGFGSRIAEPSWDQVREGVESGRFWGLYAADRDPLAVRPGLEAAVARLPFTAYQGPLSNRFAQAARWVLPACSWAEEDATWTNFEGHVQRGRAAVPCLGESRPDWAIWRDLLLELGAEFPEASAPAVFDRICREEPEFAGLSWKGLGELGRKLRSLPEEAVSA